MTTADPVDAEFIRAALGDAQRIVDARVFGGPPPETGVARLDPSTVEGLLTLQVVLPYFLGIVSGLSTEAIMARRRRGASETRLREMIDEAIGRTPVGISDDRRSEIIDMASRDVAAMGLAPDQARAVAGEVLAAIERRAVSRTDRV